MNAMNKIKKALSLLLVFVLIVTLLPMPARAADTSRTADTIFFATDRHEETSKLQSLLKALAYEPGLVVLGGDHVNNTNSGSLASITSEIQSVYPGVQTFYTYAAHDPNVTADSSNPYAFARTGEVYEGDDYYVYGVDQNDMQSSSSAATASANFVTWADSHNDGKVIFVMCHMPIHKRRNDNAGGATWMSALNDAGEDQDIVFLWGHNHTGESSADTAVYYVARGGSLTPQGGSTGTINFTYMNAGYIKNGYATQALINDQNVVFTRYSTSGSVQSTNTMTRLFAAHSHSYSVTSSTSASCGAAGSVTYTCDCGDTYTTSVPATGNHTYSSVTTDATCGAAGSVTYTCSDCGYSYTDTIDATGEHTYTSVVTAPTCETAGYTTYTCTACGYKYIANETAALGHDYEVVTVAATCTEAGSATYTCDCGDTYTEVIPATGHSYNAVVTAPTCEAAGYTTYTCVCGDTYTADETEATGHDYEAVTTSATCTKDGSIVYTCACGDSYTEVIPATGEHVYTAVTVDATCSTDGSVTYTCGCGESYTEVIAALGHDYVSVVTAPTCETAGFTTYTCEICGDTYTADETAALGHDYASVVTAPTCETAGFTTYTCEICGDTYTADETAALGHDYASVVTAPTCETAGFTTYTCETCGDTYTADETAALGHDYTSVVTAPTCDAAGYTTYTCETCGDNYTGDTVSALGHSYTSEEVDGYMVYTCGTCGDTYSEKLEEVTYTKVTKLTSGNAYVILVYSGGKYYALSHGNNNISAVRVTVSGGKITSEIHDNLVWNYSNKKLSYESNGTTYYLYTSSYWGSGSLSCSSSSYSTVSFSSNRVKVGSYYLRYSNGTIKGNRSANIAYLFEETIE